MSGLIDRQAALDICNNAIDLWEGIGEGALIAVKDKIAELPSAQLERDISKRVLWTGWKGYRYTRYKCPHCNKPVRNDDAYCHRCGQKLMFPKISFTPYVEGQKQDLIVRWEDE